MSVSVFKSADKCYPAVFGFDTIYNEFTFRGAHVIQLNFRDVHGIHVNFRNTHADNLVNFRAPYMSILESPIIP